jgi:hypothetical protein
LTLPLCPVESVHIEPCLHSALQEPEQLPWQLVPPLHWKEQLDPVGSQPVPFQVHWPVVHVHAEPVQLQPGPGQGELEVPEEPQATQTSASSRAFISSP